MTVADLIQQVRYVVNDVDKIEYNDNELIGYINQAQDYISQVCINNSFKGLLKKVDLILINNEVALPNDFIKEFSVVANNYILNSIPPDAEVDEYSYKIVGNLLYSKNDTITLYYFYMYPSYTVASDTLVIPQMFVNLLKEIVIYLALNRNEFNTSFEQKLAVLYESKILDIISSYGNSNIERPMPFKIG